MQGGHGRQGRKEGWKGGWEQTAYRGPYWSSMPTSDGSAPRTPLRLWPGVVIVLLQFLARFVVPVVAPQFMVYGVLGGIAGGFAVLVWWLFFSRAPWLERVGAIALMVIGLQGFVLFFAAVVLLARRAWMAVELLVGSIRLLTPMSYPLVVLPVMLQVVAQGVPTYQALEAFRQFLLLGPFTPTAWTSLGLLLVLDGVVVALGWIVFRASDGFVRYRAGIGKF